MPLTFESHRCACGYQATSADNLFAHQLATTCAEMREAHDAYVQEMRPQLPTQQTRQVFVEQADGWREAE